MSEIEKDGRPVSELTDGEYVFARLRKADSGCLEWTQARHTKGYGLLKRKGINMRAHRVAYEATYGPIPAGMMVLHSCDNPPCCNPAHLRVGTASENMIDAVKRGRVNQKTRIDKNDPRIFIGTLKQAAKALGVSMTTISKKRRKAVSLISAP